MVRLLSNGQKFGGKHYELCGGIDMKKNRKIEVQGSEITIVQNMEQDYISLTDIAKYKTDDTSAVIGNWMRNRNTIEFLGIWEALYNPDFKPLEFEGFRNQAGLNAFTFSPQKWFAFSQMDKSFVKNIMDEIRI